MLKLILFKSKVKYLGLLSAFACISCSSLNIGSNEFYCQENKCLTASQFLQQNSQEHTQPLSVTQYNQLTKTLLTADPQALNNPNAYLKIWFAPFISQNKVHNQQYILIPYVH